MDSFYEIPWIQPTIQTRKINLQIVVVVFYLLGGGGGEGVLDFAVTLNYQKT